ncbi:cupin domain-containing protein [Acidithiobacillus thiooxidans]|uniref:cupin domain-containing protein n=1 Tax=Acidithiobacillus thiooxidans TaxID=930 RepID=UPI001C07B809|nr:cupin domain-containing protein [Acidithiobacillus thiooxidans]MBU2838533.1 cupin domain-containing protein [Acidithiobacillus thiooxidans]MDR7925846.1 cupin domain-containing protein [Acidithiobacillus thiooxidans]
MSSHDDVGQRLLLVRKIYGLTQRELARRAGVTNGAISLIEQNRVSPSISSIKKILDGIPMSIAEFFTLDLVTSDEVFFRDDELPDIAMDPKITMKLLGRSSKGRAIQILHEYYEPGADTGEAMLRHNGEEGGVVVRGTIQLTIGDKIQNLSAGDGYYFNSQLPHRFVNNGPETCEIVSANSPPSF